MTVTPTWASLTIGRFLFFPYDQLADHATVTKFPHSSPNVSAANG